MPLRIRYLSILFILFYSLGYAQDTIKVDTAGVGLKKFYLSMNVENLWLSGHHLNWKSGLPDEASATEGIKTHCSAFVAAACEKLNIYILRPPQHSQVLLSNAQYDWLNTNEAYKDGWRKILSDDDYAIYAKAQEYANKGYVVVAVVHNPDKHSPGHIALIMPCRITSTKIKEDGPEVIMASTHNFNFISFKNGFNSHITEWPEKNILFYYNINGKL